MEVAFAHFLEAHETSEAERCRFGSAGRKGPDSQRQAEVKEITLRSAERRRGRVDDFLEALEEGIEVAERNPEVVVASSEAVFGIPSRLAREYGLEVCGSR